VESASGGLLEPRRQEANRRAREPHADFIAEMRIAPQRRRFAKRLILRAPPNARFARFVLRINPLIEAEHLAHSMVLNGPLIGLPPAELRPARATNAN
jgi:hypothetical protein